MPGNEGGGDGAWEHLHTSKSLVPPMNKSSTSVSEKSPNSTLWKGRRHSSHHTHTHKQHFWGNGDGKRA